MTRWSDPGDGDARSTTVAERAEILVDLLHLSDALPAPERRDLEATPFRELCGGA